ncbi:hypothetical protein H310_07310 [Aphanomyces invadans]|uniref:Uncharacterized protein n=1 Tax=Aphanomyces invadans TaxID=157072 RepID=A0A024U4F4_9STRA|nr:hypothetical protein H310_07310 [Aphanomyces invadans]ETW00772.1 hypothetical protein H310_07310 [Aphanomyces invadans]|eukprot:XP_008870907.1 hypothetical protein H310_07310 [Aphanomyces invadans]
MAAVASAAMVNNVMAHIPGIHSSGVDEGMQDDDWEMPLLFMTTMPINFQHNADVAAMTTFSADYEDSDSEPRKLPPKAGKIQERGKYRAQSRKQSNPYARPMSRPTVADLQLDLVKM